MRHPFSADGFSGPDTAERHGRDAEEGRHILELHDVLQLRVGPLEPRVARLRGLAHDLADLPHLRVGLLQLLDIDPQKLDGVRQLLYDRPDIKIDQIRLRKRLQILVELEFLTVIHTDHADVRMAVFVQNTLGIFLSARADRKAAQDAGNEKIQIGRVFSAVVQAFSLFRCRRCASRA